MNTTKLSEFRTEFGSPAWILVGWTRSLAGWLAYANGGVAFTDLDGEIIFNAELSDVSNLSFPWYYFGGGMKMKVLSEAYRVSFVQPNDGDDAMCRSSSFRSNGQKAAAAVALVDTKIRDICEGRSVTEIWRAIMAQV